ncbi:MAG: nuclear transport factor 2 family protein [Solirubrobacterales bacterium]
MIERVSVEQWIRSYERIWRTAGTDSLAELFCDDASYRMSPYGDAARGLAAIGALWERERAGPDEEFELSSELVAIDGDTAVARIEVAYATGAEYRDLWIIRFAADGRCREFEEWPYWPGQAIAPPTPPLP